MGTMKNTTPLMFREAVRWSEYGMACFAAATISTLIIQGVSGDFYFWSLAIHTLFGGVPLILTILTYEKLVKPLKRGEIPRNIRKWSSFLTLTGFLGVVVGVFIFANTDEKIKSLIESSAAAT